MHALAIDTTSTVVLQDKKLVRDAPLSALSNTRLGIDANVYVRRLLSSPDTREPFVAAMGGVPLALEDHIKSDMRILEHYGIKPVIVFSGLPPARKDSNGRPNLVNPAEEVKAKQRQLGWEHYEKSRNEAAMQAFGQVQLNVEDVLRVVHRAFLQRKTEFVVAPYLAWTQVSQQLVPIALRGKYSSSPTCLQLVCLERSPKAYTHSTWSSTEFLLFDGVDRLITNIDLKAGTFQFISKREIMQELSLTYDQFQDLGILAGFQDSPSIPIPEWSFKAVLDLIQRYRNGPAAISAAYTEFPPIQQSGYTDTFARSKTMIKYSLILHADDGRVMPLPLALPPPANLPAITGADVPNDIQEVFSYRLPDEVYFQLFRGLISPRLLGALTSGYWIEHPPLCGGESDEYRRFLKDIITEHPASPRCTALALLASPLNAFWRTRQVYASYYFDPNNAHPIPHNGQGAVKSLERMMWWNVPAPVIEEELRRQKVRSSYEPVKATLLLSVLTYQRPHPSI